MSETEETPAQRQARIRRQKREAKISGNATERLDKITKLSGRTPESMRNATSPALSPPTPPIVTPSTGSQYFPVQGLQNSPTQPDAAQIRAQEEFLRAFLRAPAPGSEAQGQGEGLGQISNPSLEQEDPMMKLLGSLLGGAGNTADPNAEQGLPFSPEDIAKATGLPSFVTNMVMGKQKPPPNPQAEKSIRLWRMVHVVFAVLAGIYLIFAIDRSTRMYGDVPPAPATAQNPFVVFVTGELLIQGARMATAGQSGKSGISLLVQMLRESAGDGAIMVFLFGLALWWKGMT